MESPLFSTFDNVHKYQSNEGMNESSILNDLNNDAMLQEPDSFLNFPDLPNNINASGYSNGISNNNILTFQEPDTFFNDQSNTNQEEINNIFDFAMDQSKQSMFGITNQKIKNHDDDNCTLYEHQDGESGFIYNQQDCAECKLLNDDNSEAQSQNLYGCSSDQHLLQFQNFNNQQISDSNQNYYDQSQQLQFENNNQMFQQQQLQEEVPQLFNSNYTNFNNHPSENNSYNASDNAFYPQTQSEIEQEISMQNEEEEKMNNQELLENQRNDLRNQKKFISLAHRNMKLNFGTGLTQYIELLIEKKKLLRSKDLKIYKKLFQWVLKEKSSFGCFKGWRDLWTDVMFGRLLRQVSYKYFSLNNSYASTYIEHSNIKLEYHNEYLSKIIKFQQGALNPKSFNAFAFKA